MLQACGLAGGEVPELWNITNNETVLNIHECYAKAGSHIINANTFGANRLKLSGAGFTCEEVISSVVNTARRAAYLALDIGVTGKLLRPFGDLDFEKAVNNFAQMIAQDTELI